MRRLTVLLILLLAGFTRLHALNADLRFHGDEAWFATFARNAAVHGDWWLTGTLDKPPLPIYAMALSMQAVGVTVNPSNVLDLDLRLGEWAARLPSVWAGLITCTALMMFARRITRNFWTAMIAGMIWALSPVAVGFDSMALTDPLMMAGLAVSLAAAVYDRPRLAGATWAVAFASKQQAIFVLPLIIVMLLPLSQWGVRLWRFAWSAGLGIGLLFLWDALRPGESINAYAAVNNNPYRAFADPSEWGNRARFWWDSLSAGFGVYGNWVIGVGVVFSLLRREPHPPPPSRWGDGESKLRFWKFRLLTRQLPVSPQRVNVSKPRFWKSPVLWRGDLGVRFALLYILAHIILPFNLYERYILPPALLLTLPAAALITTLSRRRKRYVFPLLMAVSLIVPYYQPSTPRDPDADIIDLAGFINAQGLGTIVYNHWLGWEMGYYLGAWSDKRVVYYPTPEEFAVDAPLNPDTAPRLMIAPRWIDTAAWLAAAGDAGFEITPAYDNRRYVAWWLKSRDELGVMRDELKTTRVARRLANTRVVGTPHGASAQNKSSYLAAFSPSRFVAFSPSRFVAFSPSRFVAFPPSPLVGEGAGGEGNSTCPSTQRVAIPNPRFGREVYVSVYLPCVPDGETVPYLIFLHGSNADDHHLIELGLETAAQPFAVVMPFGEDEANTNEFGESSWGKVVLDLIPDFERRFPLDGSRRAIGGISRGGFWAYQIGLSNPEMFRAIGGHSAFFDLYHAPPGANPLDLALMLTPQTAPALYLDRGADDYAAPGLDIMDARLRRADIAHTYIVNPTGEHNNDYWRDHLPEYLNFYAAALTADPTPTPTVVPSSGVTLFVPIAAYPSPLYDLDPSSLSNVIAGGADSKLTVSAATRESLAGYGVRLSADIRTLDTAEAVQNDLFRDRSRWTILPWDALNLRLRILMVGGQHPVDILANGYGLAFESDSPNFDPAKLSRVMVSGVTALGRGTTTALDSNGVEWAAAAIAPLTTRADLFHISSEVSAIEGCPSVESPRLGGSSSFCAKPEHLELFTLLGADLIELSGNHNNDYGYDAYLSTLDTLHADGFATVGGGKTLAAARQPFLWEGAGGRVAWLACNAVGPYYAIVDGDGGNPGAALCDGAWLHAELPRLKAENDVVILTVQYFEFDQHNPTDEQRIDFATYASWGADYVGGTQAHFPQTLNVIPGYGGEEAFVHYGLGNFVFDQTFWAGVRFMVDELYIYEGRLHSVMVYPGIIEGQGRPRLMTPTERDNFWYVLFNQYGEF